MLKLRLQYFGHLMRRYDSLEKTLMLRGFGGRRRRDDRGWDGWMASQIPWTWVWVNFGSWCWTGRPGALRFMSQRVGHDWATGLNWTELNWMAIILSRSSSWWTFGSLGIFGKLACFLWISVDNCSQNSFLLFQWLCNLLFFCSWWRYAFSLFIFFTLSKS